LLFDASSLLSDAHQGENSGQTKENGRDPTGEKGGENPRFSEGYKNVKDDPIDKTKHHTNPNAQSHSPRPTGFQGEGDAD
jgi:hypothetical protein